MEWTPIIVALIAAGLLTYLRDAVKWYLARRREQSPDGQRSLSIATVDQSLTVVAKARDELEADNALLRATMAEQRAAHASEMSDLIRRHAAERAIWGQEKTDLKSEIADLERRLREMLTEVENIRRRTT